jgi:DNA-binding transcriptional regulator YhcF (GntR family)
MPTPPLAIRVDLSSPLSVYRQIANAIRAHLVAGAVPPGQTLPTVRQLALDLGLNHNTVAEAYRLLAEEGWLSLRRGDGATVLERSRPRAESGEVDGFRRRLRELVAEVQGAGVSAAVLARELRRAADETA